SVGASLVVMLVFIIASSADQGVNWAVFAINLRIWAIIIGIIGCLVVAPVGVIVRLRRRESLVLSPTASPWHVAANSLRSPCCRGPTSNGSSLNGVARWRHAFCPTC